MIVNLSYLPKFFDYIETGDKLNQCDLVGFVRWVLWDKVNMKVNIYLDALTLQINT